jgi:hypothetical protein
MQAEMLADREGNIGVILFLNTSLSGQDARASLAILDALWKYAESLRAGVR